MSPDEVRSIRHSLGLTQQAFADQLGLSRGHVSRLEMQSGAYRASHMAEKMMRLLLASQYQQASESTLPPSSTPTDL